MFSFFFYDVIAGTMSRFSDSKFVSILSHIQVFRTLNGLSSISGAESIATRPQILNEFLRGFMGISLINFPEV